MTKQILNRLSLPPLLIGLFTLLAVPALARKGPPLATGIVSGWIPNNGVLCSEDRGPGVCSTQLETYLGDMWTFVCPPGGKAIIRVDTKDDTDTVESCIDPIAHVFDSKGTHLASGDEDEFCSFPPVCGFKCPAFEVPCAKGALHSVVVRDYGDASTTAEQCDKGGGYILHVTVEDKRGLRVSPVKVKLGGGSNRKIPKWMRTMHQKQGPLLDDEGVPTLIIDKP